MRILITGGRGTIGRALSESLRSNGYDVVSVDISHDPEEVGFSLRTDVEKPNYVRCDVGDYCPKRKTTHSA